MMWLREFFRPARRPVLGVCKYNGGVILAGISLPDESGNTELIYIERITMKSSDEELWEQVQTELLKQNTIYEAVLCIPQEEVLSLKKPFPAIKDKEMDIAVRWELAANEPFAGDYIGAWDRTADGMIQLGAICRTEMEVMRKKLQHIGIRIDKAVTAAGWMEDGDGGCLAAGGIVCFIPDRFKEVSQGPLVRETVIGAMLAFCGAGLIFWAGNNLLGRLHQQYSCLRIAIAAAIISAIFFLLVTGYALWRQNLLDDEIEAVRHSLQLMDGVSELQLEAESKEAMLDRLEKKLAECMSTSLPAYAAMVHLGCTTEKSVWLTEVSLERAEDGGPVILIKGEAMDYDSLLRYLSQLNGDSDFFLHGVKLDKSEDSEARGISFQIRGLL